jgi:hypothetical protein
VGICGLGMGTVIQVGYRFRLVRDADVAVEEPEDRDLNGYWLRCHLLFCNFSLIILL